MRERARLFGRARYPHKFANSFRGNRMLPEEITSAQRSVKTDAYQMSIGEIVSMYDNAEIIIDPEFQRFFRWEIGQKSKLIESLLLGIPLPPIFVFEKEDS